MQLPHDTSNGKQILPPPPPQKKSSVHKALISTMQLAMFLVSTYVSRHRLNASTVSTGSSVIYSTCYFICEQWRLVTKDYAWQCLHDKNWTTVIFISPHLTARRQQGGTNPMRQLARATKFWTSAPNTVFVIPQRVTCSISAFWSQGFWSGLQIFRKLVYSFVHSRDPPVRDILRTGN
jgi:hypothetical protein